MDDRFNIGKLSSDDSKHIVDKYGLTEENTDNYLIIKFVKISTDYIDIKSPYKIIVFDNKNNDKLKKKKFEEYVKNNIKYSLSFWHSFKTKDSYETKYENILYPLKNDNIGLILLNDALALTFPLGYKQPGSRHFISYEDIKKVNILYYNQNIEGNYEWGGSFTEALTLEIIFRNDEENDKTIEKTIYYYHYDRGEYESGEYGSVRRNQFNFDNCEYGGSADLFYKSFKTLIDKLLIDYGLELELKKDEKIRL